MMGDNIESNAAEPSGILLVRGMKLVILPGGLRLSLRDGAATMTPHVIMDMTLHWVRLASENLLRCEAAAAELGRIWLEDPRPDVTEALESELRAGMQACAASAFALDAFYASVQEAAPIDVATRKAWQKKKKARHSQISETLRLHFKMSEAEFKELAEAMKHIFALRDEAVHPKAGPQEFALHPTIGVGVERRIAAFSSVVAKQTVQTTANIIVFMVRRPKTKLDTLTSYCSTLLTDIEPIATELATR